jgi:uncharacterized membrane protein
MRWLYLGSVYLHVLAAITWVGGSLFLAAVVVPVARRIEDPTERARLIGEVGRRFRGLGWLALATLVVTGALNAVGRWGEAAVINPAFYASAPGRLLALKVLLVGILLLMSAVHDFVLGPRLSALGRTAPDEPERLRLRRRTVSLARLELALGLVVVLLGVLLVRPG